MFESLRNRIKLLLWEGNTTVGAQRSIQLKRRFIQYHHEVYDLSWVLQDAHWGMIRTLEERATSRTLLQCIRRIEKKDLPRLILQLEKRQRDKDAKERREEH